MWHHLAKAHHHIKHHAKNFLVHAAEEHPILATGLALVGAGLVISRVAGTTPTTNPSNPMPPPGA